MTSHPSEETALEVAAIAEEQQDILIRNSPNLHSEPVSITMPRLGFEAYIPLEYDVEEACLTALLSGYRRLDCSQLNQSEA